MTDAQVLVVQGTDDLNSLLEEHGIDFGGARAIPLCIPIGSLDDIPVALENLFANRDKVAEQIKAELEPKTDSGDAAELASLKRAFAELDEQNTKLRDQNTRLRTLLHGIMEQVTTAEDFS